VCGLLYKGMCGTLELHLVAFWIWLPIRRISRRGSRIAMRPAAGSLPIIQCALGDASCRQRTLRQTSHRVCKDGDIGTTAYFLCDKQIRSSLVTEFALILSTVFCFPSSISNRSHARSVSACVKATVYGGSALIGNHSQNKVS
jgi:hypothetical protein